MTAATLARTLAALAGRPARLVAAMLALALLASLASTIEPPRWPLASLASAARADEPASGEYPARALIEPPRWPLASLASREGARWSIGPPCLAVRLVRNRRGRLGTWIVEWNSAEQRFEPVPLSEPVAGPVLDRPCRAAVA